MKRCHLLVARLFLLLGMLLFLLTSQVASSQSLEQLRQQGNAALQAEQYNKAETIFRRVIQLDPKNTEAYLWLANVRIRQGQPDDAIALYHQVLQIQPNNRSATQLLQLTLDQEQDRQKIRALVVAGLKEQAQSLQTTLKLIVEQIDSLQRLIEIFPNAPSHLDDYIDLGNALLNAHQTNEQWFDSLYQIKRLQPDADVTPDKTSIGSSEQWLTKAIAAYQKAIQLNPKSSAAYYGFGNALRQQNRLQDALAAYRKASGLAPNNLFIQTRLKITEQQIKKHSLTILLPTDRT